MQWWRAGGNGTPNGRRTPALVLGSGNTLLGVIRTLRRAKIPVYVVSGGTGAADRKDFARRSKCFRSVAAAGTATWATQDLASHLRDLPLDRAVLIPCSDSWAMQTAKLPRSIAARFPSSLASANVLQKFIDKGRFAGLLSETGIPHPQTHIIDTPEQLSRLPEEAFRDAFLKPLDSQRFFQRYGIKAIWARSRAEACKRFLEVQSEGYAVLLQEYVPGPTSNHYFVDGFVDAAGRVVTKFARRRLRMYPPDFGNSTYMVSVPLSEAAGACEAIDGLMSRVAYRGVFSAEFKRDARDGMFKILELNARPWWYVEFAARCGVDVVTLAYRDALHLPLPANGRYAVGRPLVYPYYDLPACRALHQQHLISMWDWVRSWVASTQPVFQWADPMPAASATAGMMLGYATRRARALTGRAPFYRLARVFHLPGQSSLPRSGRTM